MIVYMVPSLNMVLRIDFQAIGMQGTRMARATQVLLAILQFYGVTTFMWLLADEPVFHA